MTAPFVHPPYRPSEARKPVMGVLCCNEQFDRPIQSVASRFIAPLASLSGATVLLVPAVQWHPEWQAAHRPEGRAFFRLIGDALHRQAGATPPEWVDARDGRAATPL